MAHAEREERLGPARYERNDPARRVLEFEPKAQFVRSLHPCHDDSIAAARGKRSALVGGSIFGLVKGSRRGLISVQIACGESPREWTEKPPWKNRPSSSRLQPLTPETFKPYGQVLENRQPVLPEVEPGEGRVAIELLKFKRPTNPRRISMMATHFSYNQTFIPLRGTIALVVAPPPRNRSAGHERYEIDYERLAAFFLEPGQAALIDKGTWHYAVALGAECDLINVTRKDPGEGTSDIDAEMRMDRIPRCARTSKSLDFARRDKRVLELEA